MKRCIKGFTCIKTTTLVLSFVSLLVLGYVYRKKIFTLLASYQPTRSLSVSNDITYNPPVSVNVINRPSPSSNNPYLGERCDILMNPYTPPLKRPEGQIPGMPKIDNNIFEQSGMLTAVNKGGQYDILPLFSRPISTSRDYYQYYTMGNQNNGGIKLPIVSNGRSALNEYGIKKLYSDDIVTVEGIDATYKVYVYETQQIRY